MKPALQGVRVLVTRPTQQADNLCRLINTAGGQAIHFPVMQITASDQLSARQLQRLFADSSHVIFTSRNAVIYAYQLAGDLVNSLQGKVVFAVGVGSSQELADKGISNVISPGAKSDSESLLQLDQLNQTNIRQKHLLIVRGNGGRTLLKEVLESRGAVVGYADVYQRQIPDYDPDIIESIWQDSCPDVIVITSNEGLQNLLLLSGDKYRTKLLNSRLVVMSNRILEQAASSGFRFPAIVATEQTDLGLLQAVGLSMGLMQNER